MLWDINYSELLFDRKVVVFSEYFYKVLPIVRRGTRKQHIDASLVSSYIWLVLIIIKLTKNIRARLDLNFLDFLLKLGNVTNTF